MSQNEKKANGNTVEEADVENKVEDVKEDRPEAAFSDEEADEEIVTMLDVLKEETELEEDADAVLGGSDETKCSYNEGYVGRQALYACKTCADETGISEAGVCFACSLKCHDGHECYELYTKRNFRCDCGNKSKFGDNKVCQLIPEKDPENPLNRYNHNFSGTYCVCERPYPDPDNDDVMIQCVSCEDWFHGEHLSNTVPEDFAEMICGTCMERSPFLWFYSDSLSSKRSASPEDQPPAKKLCTDDRSDVGGQEEKVAADALTTDGHSGLNSGDEVVDKKNKCHLKELQKQKDVSEMKGARFFSEFEWRSKLCLCKDCQDLYQNHSLSFLPDIKDTVKFYEEEGKKRIRCESSCSSTSSMERGMEAFGQMPRNQQIEMLHGYNRLETALKEFLKKFAEEGKTVTKEDVAQFFERFNREKDPQDQVNPLHFTCGR